MSTTHEWYNDLRNLMRYRISSLLIGDALVCDETGWRVDCGEDAKRLGERQFIISCQGDELAKRKRIESTVDFLVRHDAPKSMVYVFEGAKHLLQLGRLDDIDLLGYLPSVDTEVDQNRYCRRRFARAHIAFPSCNTFKDAAVSHAPANVVRLVVQEHQATWFTPEFCRA